MRLAVSPASGIRSAVRVGSGLRLRHSPLRRRPDVWLGMAEAELALFMSRRRDQCTSPPSSESIQLHWVGWPVEYNAPFGWHFVGAQL